MENLVPLIISEWVTDQEKKEIAKFLGVSSYYLLTKEANPPWAHLVKKKAYIPKENASHYAIVGYYGCFKFEGNPTDPTECG